MGLDNIRENILRSAESKIKNMQIEKSLDFEARALIKMGNEFCKATNYSLGFFQYFRALKKMSLLFLKKKLGDIEGMSENEAISLVAEKKFLGFDNNDFKKMKKLFNNIINRKEVKTKDVKWIKNIIKGAVKKIL